MPPTVALGVLLDMAGFYGVDMVEEGRADTQEDIISAAEKQGVEFRKGDVVLFHSGWLDSDRSAPDPRRFGAGEPGLGKTGAEYLIEKEVLAIGGDTWGLEAVPFPEGTGVFEVHQMLIPKYGTYILENMDTGELLADEA